MTRALNTTQKEAHSAVKSNKNRAFSPVVTTDEVAAELDVDAEAAFALLSEVEAEDYVSKKPVGEEPADPGQYVWW